MELISVIVPVYKVEQYLDKCIESIVSQTYTNLEIILVDDGSPDDCPQMCDAWTKKDSRVKVIHKENGGSSSAKNVGIVQSSGRYIAFVDSDDSVDSDYIEYMYRLLKENDADLSMCKHRIISESGEVFEGGRKGERLFSAYDCLEDLLYFKDVDTSPWGKLYKRELFDEIRYPEGMIFEDLATTYKLILESEKIMCGFETKYSYLVRKNSVSNTEFNDTMFNYSKITDELSEVVIEHYPNLQKATMARRVWSRFSVINLMINSNKSDYVKEKREYRAFIRANGFSLLFDKKVRKNEKAAIILMSFSSRLYEYAWRKVRGRIL